MSIKITNQLNLRETKEINGIVDACRQFDKTKSKPTQEDTGNISPNLPRFFIYSDNNKIIGFVYAYIPSYDIAYISAYTLPAYRNRGIFKSLLRIVSDTLGSAGIKKLRFSIECNSESGYKNLQKYDGVTFDHCDYLLSNEKYSSKILYNKLTAKLITRDMESELKEYYVSIFDRKDNVRKIVEAALLPGHEGYFIFDRDTIVGVFTLRSEIHSMVIDGIYIREDLRKKGYGMLIMDYALKRALQLKSSVLIECSSDNTAALNLYRSAGFKEIYRTDYYSCNLS